MIHLDLFSGIGGFALAADWVWGEDHHIHSFVEIDPFCQKVLKKHWPGVPIYEDIKTFTYTEHNRCNGKKISIFPREPRQENPMSSGNNRQSINLLTGGFPCQSFSVAGKRRGKADDRYLWPEMFRIISEARPTWVIAENVTGIVNMALDTVLSDLESEGYQVQPFIIPACAVKAPHRRDRVWIVGYSDESGRERFGRGREKGTTESDCHVPDTINKGLFGGSAGSISEQPGMEQGQQEWKNSRSESSRCNEINVTDTDRKGSQERKVQSGDSREKQPATIGGSWNENWLEVATRLCGVDAGIPRRMDRVNRLKALGNAIVPQVVYPIMMAIKEIEDAKKSKT